MLRQRSPMPEVNSTGGTDRPTLPAGGRRGGRAAASPSTTEHVRVLESQPAGSRPAPPVPAAPRPSAETRAVGASGCLVVRLLDRQLHGRSAVGRVVWKQVGRRVRRTVQRMRCAPQVVVWMTSISATTTSSQTSQRHVCAPASQYARQLSNH